MVRVPEHRTYPTIRRDVLMPHDGRRVAVNDDMLWDDPPVDPPMPNPAPVVVEPEPKPAPPPTPVIVEPTPGPEIPDDLTPPDDPTPPVDPAPPEDPTPPKEPTTPSGETIAEQKDNINYAIDAVLDDIYKIVKQTDGCIHTEFGMDANGNIKFQENETTIVFNQIIQRVTREINDFKVKGGVDLMSYLGEDNLKKLVKAAWIDSYNSHNSSSSINTETFVKTVLNNLKSMINTVSQNPELLEVFTTRTSYADSSVTKGVKHYNTRTTYGGDELINYGGAYVKYADGTIHIDNTIDDKDYQDTMSDVLKNLIAKYPNLDPAYITKIYREAQAKALDVLKGNVYDCPYGTGNNSGRVEDSWKNWGGRDNRKKDGSYIHMDQLVQMTLYQFDKSLYKGIIKDGATALNKTTEVTPSDPQGETVPKVEDPAEKTKYKEPCEKAAYAIDTVLDDIDKITKITGDWMHTEFGLDRNGNIVFQEPKVKNAYDDLTNRIIREMNDFNVKGGYDLVGMLGGTEKIKDLVQAAWIATYNTFDSSTSHWSEDFIGQVLKNLKTMVNNIAQDSSKYDLYTQKPSYADTSLTTGLKHYNTNTTSGRDQTINYGGQVVVYTDGTVHISNTVDDNDYQQTMEPLLQRLIEKYPNVEPEKITKIFRQAQQEALDVLQNNYNDCPYGTGNNSGRVENYTKDWGGRDNRKKDRSKIHMDQLVQMTLYQFDKLILKAHM